MKHAPYLLASCTLAEHQDHRSSPLLIPSLVGLLLQHLGEYSRSWHICRSGNRQDLRRQAAGKLHHGIACWTGTGVEDP